MPSFSVLRSLEVFLFSRLRSGLSIQKPFARIPRGTKLKDQFMKKCRLTLALAGACFSLPNRPAISLDDIQLWTGSGTNRAALVIEWNSPESVQPNHGSRPGGGTKPWSGATVSTARPRARKCSRPFSRRIRSFIVAESFGTFIGYNLSGNGNMG
jgi:hypothetical protein